MTPRHVTARWSIGWSRNQTINSEISGSSGLSSACIARILQGNLALQLHLRLRPKCPIDHGHRNHLILQDHLAIKQSGLSILARLLHQGFRPSAGWIPFNAERRKRGKEG